MSRSIWLGAVLGASILSAPASAQDHPAHHLFAQMETTWDAEISPDGTHVALGCSPAGLREVCVFDLTGQGQNGRISPPSGARIFGLQWAGDDYLLVNVSSVEQVNTGRGLMDITYTRLISWDKNTGESALMLSQYGGIVSDASNITSLLLDEDDTIAMQMTFSRNFEDDQTASRIVQGQDYATEVLEVSLESGRYGRRLARSGSQSVIDFIMDPQGEVIARILFDNESDIYRIRQGARGGETIYEAEHGVFLPGVYGAIEGGQALAITMPDTNRLQRMDMATGEITDFPFPVTESSAVIDPFSGELLGFRNLSSTSLLPFTRFEFDDELKNLQEQLTSAIPEQSAMITSWTPDRQTIVLTARDPGRPAVYYLFERESRSLSVLASEQDHVLELDMPDFRTLTYTARDGLEIPATLYTPPASRRGDGALPLVVLPHGGPRGQDNARYDWQAAALAYEGYAVLQPNFRGSIGFGIEHETAGYGEFGRGMITDIIDGARYLAAEGLTRSDYCVMGGSYGGYAALMMALDDAENVRCAVAFAPVTDPMSMLSRYRSNSADNDDGVEYWELYMGSRFQSDEAIAAQSPRRRAASLSRPVLIIHGEDDTTVQVEQSRWFAESAASTGMVTFIPMEGEDHYLGSATIRVRLLGEALSFLDQHYPSGN